MIQNNNLSPLPFYRKLEYQDFRKPWAYGNVPCIAAPMSDTFLPFFFVLPSSNGSFTKYEVYSIKGNKIVEESSASFLRMKTLGNITVAFYYPSPSGTITLPTGEGRYYIKLTYTDGNVNTDFYSEVFTLIDTVDDNLVGYARIEWYDDYDFEYNGGFIPYEEGYKNIMWLKTDIGMPEYPYEEEATERDGFLFLKKQLSEKRYHFVIAKAPECICDVLRLVRLADHIKVTDTFGRDYECDSFLTNVNWLEQGHYASVQGEFDTDTVLKKIPHSTFTPTPPAEDYLRVNPSILSFLAEGEENNISIESNVAWSITNLPEWLSIKEGQSGSGSGNAIVTLVAGENTGSQRSQTIVVTGVGVSSVNVAVSQTGSEPAIELLNLTGNISGDGGVVKAYVRANKTWNTVITQTPSAVTRVNPVTGSASNIYTEVQITINENPSSSQTRTIKVKFQCTDYTGEYETFEITQAAKEVEPYINLWQPTYGGNSIELNAEWDSATDIQVIANGNWRAEIISDSDDWLSKSYEEQWPWSGGPKTFDEDYFIWPKYTANTGARRQGIVKAWLIDHPEVAAYFYINQKAGSVVINSLEITPSGTNNVAYNVTSEEVQIVSNVGWIAEGSGGALVSKNGSTPASFVLGDGNATIQMSFPQNNTASVQTRALEVRSTGISPQIIRNLNVKQAAEPSEDPYLEVDNPILEFDSIGETKRIVVTGNVSWAMNTSLIPSWLHLSVTSGTAGSTNIDVTADPLVSYTPREVTLRFMGGPTATASLFVHQNGAENYKVVLENTAYGATKINNTTFKGRGGAGAFMQMHIRRSYVIGAPADILHYVVKSQNNATIQEGTLTWGTDEYESIPVLYESELFDHDTISAAHIEITGTTTLETTTVINGIINIWPSTAPI